MPGAFAFDNDPAVVASGTGSRARLHDEVAGLLGALRARRQVLQGVPVDRAALPDVPRLVIGAGLDASVPEAELERLAEWLGAEYEPFGAHSHFGLVMGEESFLQVAETMRAFLETHRL